MLVTKDTTEEVPIPHEDGHWMQFRRLSWLEMTEAAETAERRSVKKMTQFGSEAVGAIMSSHEAKQAMQTAAATAAADGDGDTTPTKVPTVASYDRDALLVNGITAWSYEEKPSPKTIRQLDAETARWAAEQIFELSRERTKEERGNA